MTSTAVRAALNGLLSGAICLGAIGGAALGQAAPGDPGPPAPPVPGPSVPGTWMPGMPPGHNPFGPPGQVMRMPMLDVPGVGEVANPYFNVPPGHWGDVGYVNPQNIIWRPPGFPNLTAPLNLVWNATADAWGVFVDNAFVPYPVPLPAP